jgi:glycosyltransferase involved in cell wall biosynthesis
MLGLFAPFPPARSGVADHAAALLPVLRRHGRVEIAPPHADLNVYHLGNNQLHAEIYQRALAEPGLIVLHDAVLHHFALGFLTREQYIEEFVYNYGEWTRGLAGELWGARARSAADPRYFSHAMLRRVVERSRAVVVHNAGAASIVRAHVPSARIFEIPLLYSESIVPRLPAARAAPMVCGVFGHLRQSKRLAGILRVFDRLRSPLLVAGPCPEDLERSLEPWLRAPHVQRIGYTSAMTFQRLTHSVDLCINLRYPTTGETSAITVQMMGAGIPVVVTDNSENAPWPDGGCVRIPHGIDEEAQLEEAVRWLIAQPEDARAIGTRGREHVLSNNSPERVGELYWRAVQATID